MVVSVPCQHGAGDKIVCKATRREVEEGRFSGYFLYFGVSFFTRE